jgi:hypothetical protein
MIGILRFGGGEIKFQGVIPYAMLREGIKGWGQKFKVGNPRKGGKTSSERESKIFSPNLGNQGAA